ncbi:TonB-dependent receptor [Novosphingobium sp. PY1]|uniref:Heme transporter BhuA n=1 Tax=Ochrobactrum sp. PW1 TaxID=1882222 RepID=A0A292GSY6_9HYPH|nr:TonB-dependent receptor [Novosphingobium sp. PY1]BBA74281.1 TonB-dependent receptor [Ochrobactrum sp. PW1]GFM29130.1 TonB-dependent receptor [Novosphingobium sp. PY1]
MRTYSRLAGILLASTISSQAFAADAADEDQTTVGTGQSDSEEILVSARRRSETAQDVPLAISVVGGEHIDNTGTFNVGRLQQLTPTLQFYSSNPRNTAVNIRGIGAPFGLTNDGIEQGVGIYVDDVYYSRVASATFDFLDVAQIEVLRGPQGTLYGKNTSAGAINITTRQPTFDFEGRAEISIGNLGFKQSKAAVSGPLSATLAARVALSATNRRGTVYNVATGNWINEQDNLGLRGQLLWRPTNRLDVTLQGDVSTQNPECCAQIYVKTGATQRALNRQFSALAVAQDYSVPSTNPFDRVTDVDAELKAGNKIGGVNLRVKWDAGTGTLSSVTAWRFWDWKPANDRDFTGLPITIASNNPSKQDQYTQELRYSQSGGNVDFVLGLFGFHQNVRTQGLQVQGPAASRWLLNPGNALSGIPAVLDGLIADNDIRLDNTSAALFGQASWKVTNAFTVQPGFRVNYDQKKGLYDSVVTGSASDGTRQLVQFSGPYANDPWIAAQRGVLAPQRFETKFSDWNFSYDLTLSFKLAADVLAYATYARSFKSGGVNLNGVPSDADGNPLLAAATVKPETVNHYEAGIKAQFWDRKATLNLSAFRTEIGNYQALVTNGQLGVLRGYLANAGKVRTQGVEWDFSVRPSGRFNAYVNGAYTDATYRKFTDAPCPPELSGGGTGTPIATPGVPGNSPANCDISGQRLPGVSKWSLSYGAEVNAPVPLLGRDGEAYLGFDGNYRTAFSSNPTPSAYTWIKGYALTNFRAGFRTDAGFDIYGWVRNAFDVSYFEQLAVPSGNTGLIVGQPGDPRTWGLTVKIEI